MTEYELIDLFYECNDAITTVIMNFISILSGYLIASHYLGRNISLIQFGIMTAAYSLIMILTMYAAWERMQEAILLTDAIRELDGLWEPTFLDKASNTTVIAAFTLSYIGSIFFALAARKREKISA